jgi:glyoxylase-like metal-dependent hydrolase (beta-lactamase superfamily II)
MIIERSMHDGWLSNTYLVADELGSHAVMIDAGGPVEPLLRVLERMRFQLTHVLLTHHHHDHVSELDQVTQRWPDAAVLIHPAERDAVAGTTGTMEPGEVINSGALEIEPIHTPGHTGGMLSLLVGGTDVFTGDTLFKRSVGGVRAPGHTTYADLKSSIMEKLLKLPPQTRIQPVCADLARRRPRRDRILHCIRQARHADPLGRGLRRRPQGLGALGGRLGRHRARVAGGAAGLAPTPAGQNPRDQPG